MSKPLRTAAQLVALLNAELGRHDACIGVSVYGITRLPMRGLITLGQPPSFTVWVVPSRTMLTLLRRSGAPASTAVRSSVRGGFIGPPELNTYAITIGRFQPILR